MNFTIAVVYESYAWLGLVPAAAVVAALIFNVSTFGTRDMNRKAGVATNLLLIALLVEFAAWTVRSYGGGTRTGVFGAIVICAILHVISASIALGAIWEFRTIGKWPYGRRRATWGFWLNVIALLVLAAWFYLATDEKLFNRIFR
jgi:hypothetical protein